MKWLTSLISVFIALILICPCPSTAVELDTTQRDDSYSCQTIHKSLKEAYYSQIDLLRRGLPVRVVQSEFVYAANYYAYYSYNFRWYNLNTTCVWTSLWYGLFDYQNRAKWALEYLRQIRLWNPEINFLNSTQYPSIPDMEPSVKAHVDAHWHQIDHRLKLTPRGIYLHSDFVFPRNVDVLYDPGKDLACSEYHKFGDLNSTSSLPATSVFIALGMASIKLHHIGGKKSSIEQMLNHFAGYAFDGVRCTRNESEVLSIPLRLVEAYSRNLGFIYASSQKGALPNFSEQAFQHVFEDEISSLTSYNSWGHTQYAKLVGRMSIPAIVNSVDTLLDSANFETLMAQTVSTLPSPSPSPLPSSLPSLLPSPSSSPSLSPSPSSSPGSMSSPSSSPSPSSSSSSSSSNSSDSDDEADDEEEYDDRFIVLERQSSCGTGYMWLSRENPVTASLQHCCASVCEVFALLSSSVDPFPHEECCYRCNEHHGCPSGLTEEDIFDNDNTYIIVPEYGEQSQQTVTMVDI